MDSGCPPLLPLNGDVAVSDGEGRYRRQDRASGYTWVQALACVLESNASVFGAGP